MNLILLLIKKIKGEKVRGIKIEKPKIRTVGTQQGDFNAWMQDICKPKNS